MDPKRERISQGVARVQAEGLTPVGQFCERAGATEQALTRWIIEGKRGVFLDGIKRGGVWHTSAPAVERFLAAVAAKCQPAA